MPKRWASPLEEKSASLLCFSWCCQCHSEWGWDSEYNLLSLPTSYSQSINTALHAVCVAFTELQIGGLSFLAVIRCKEERCQIPTRKSKAGQQPKSKQHESKLFYTVKLKRDWNALPPWMPTKAHHFCTNTFRGTNSMNQSSGSLSWEVTMCGLPHKLTDWWETAVKAVQHPPRQICLQALFLMTEW